MSPAARTATLLAALLVSVQAGGAGAERGEAERSPDEVRGEAERSPEEGVVDPHRAAGTLPDVPDVPSGDATLRGRIVHPTRPDAVGGVPVILYALPSDGQPGLRGAVADADGAFAFEGISNDPSIAYLLGARYAEVPFGTRTRFTAGQDELRVEVEVSDPTADVSGIEVGEVRLIVERGCEDLAIRESIEVRNPSDRVVYVPPSARAGAAPLFETRLPEAAGAFGSPIAGTESGLEHTAGVVRFWGPLHPGAQEVVFSYALPGGAGAIDLERGFAGGAERLVVATHRDGPTARGERLRSGEPLSLEGRPFRRWVSDRLEPGAPVAFTLDVPPASAPGRDVAFDAAQLWLELDDAALTVDERYRLQSGAEEPLVSPSDAPLLCLQLPEGAQELRFSSGALALGLARDASGALAVHGPIPPGDSMLAIRYLLPAGSEGIRLVRRFPLPFPLLHVFVADTGVVAESPRLHRLRPIRTEDRTFVHLEGFEIEAGEEIALSLTRLTPSGRSPLGSAAVLALAAAAAVAFLAAPLRGSRSESEEAPEPPAVMEREAVIAAIRDLDHDYETGKLSAEDYEALRGELRARAVALLREEREQQAARADAAPAAVPAACPGCGAAVAEDARFCSQCGTRLEPESAAGGGTGA